ncbi:hypothetical protein DIZ81_10275 [Legionella taurinensis]|uniref:Xcc1710-like domain-containing protein n=1 Tax=Legionella taurinensis TaxID=70611 RepID=A0A3A5L2P9_9GAMM|nr:MTH938/NDUFAF3 family protein [Legionella taurinensis]MDX1838285.1 MTH938/NDUFAF3 family protein [Legionella taurinensis]PUT39225.1 hypothetical protein DB744_10285 [Legionella taurinensis]PUT40571.1 hypothetical protein DB746_10805 [Legionella taurinensis]PUT43991.1 hypothetical protein DB743_09005 [Legionella taurinensis]PUT46253.1 hypothetical protein DB745_11290 [Legionella taurinensis]
MQINLEAHDPYAVEAYSDTAIQINATLYTQSLVVSTHELISEWPVRRIEELSDNTLASLLKHQPEIILIGHGVTGQFAPPAIYQQLTAQRMALECMSIGAACRTYNVLLSEGRRVVLGIIL